MLVAYKNVYKIYDRSEKEVTWSNKSFSIRALFFNVDRQVSFTSLGFEFNVVCPHIDIHIYIHLFAFTPMIWLSCRRWRTSAGDSFRLISTAKIQIGFGKAIKMDNIACVVHNAVFVWQWHIASPRSSIQRHSRYVARALACTLTWLFVLHIYDEAN